MRYLIHRVLHETPNSLGVALKRPGEDRLCWGKIHPQDADRDRLDGLYDLLKALDCPLIPFPQEWGVGLVNGHESAWTGIFAWIDGKTLDAAWPGASTAQREGWIRGVLRGLHVLHTQGIVHGDIAASNILIDGTGAVRLIDLDWHHDRDETVARRSGHLETMPPEVLAGESVDGRADLYALGLVLWPLLGNAPLPDVDGRMQGDLSAVHLGKGNPWRTWFEKCLRRSPDQRWRDAFEAFQFAPFSQREPFFDAPLHQSSRALIARAGESLDKTLRRISGIVPSPCGFLETCLLKRKEGRIGASWHSWMGHERVVQAANEGRALTEALLESVHKDTADMKVGAASSQLEPLLRPLDAAYERRDHEHALRLANDLLAKPDLKARERAAILNYAGLCHWAMRRFDAAAGPLEEAHRLFARLKDARGIIKSANNLGMVHRHLGGPDAARRWYLAGLEEARRSGTVEEAATVLFNLAGNAQAGRRIEEALSWLEEARERFERERSAGRLALAIFNMTLLWDYCGEFGRAQDCLRAALARPWPEPGSRRMLGLRLLHSLMESGKNDAAGEHLMALQEEIATLPADQARLENRVRLQWQVESGVFSGEGEPVAPDALVEALEPKLFEEAYWNAVGWFRQGEQARASRWLDRIDPDRIPEPGLLRLRVLTLQQRLESDPESPSARHRLREIDAMLARWADSVPKSMKRSLFSHPTFHDTRQLLKAQEAPAQGRTEWSLRTLRALASASQAPDVERMAQRSLDALVELCGAERGFLMTLDQGHSSVIATVNLRKDAVERPEAEISRSLIQKVLDSGVPLVVANAQHEQAAGRSVHDLHLMSLLLLPLSFEGRVVGLCYLDHRYREGAFGEVPLDLLMPLASIIASSLVLKRMDIEMREQNAALEEARRHMEALNREIAGQMAQKEEHNRQLMQTLTLKDRDLARRYSFGRLSSSNGEMQKLCALAGRLIDSNLPVLITGESGTGKEMLAKTMHYQSLRASKPFIAIHCGAIPEGLVESELFGHVRGAFTGADRDRAGAFVEADGGTLFLDEIGAMPVASQVKMLRVLQDSRVQPVGTTRAVPVHIRIIAATNEDVGEAMRAGRFREDLYYRISGCRVDLPPLRRRIEDIPLLIEQYLEERAGGNAMAPDFDVERMKRWMIYPWPGNVRELFNHLERFCLTGEDPIEPGGRSKLAPARSETSLFDSYIEEQGSPGALRAAVKKFERDLMKLALKRTGGNASQAAKMLGINRSDFYYRNRRQRALQ